MKVRENEPLRSAAAYVIAATNGSHNTMTYHEHDKCLPWALDMLRAALALKPGAIDDLAPPLNVERLAAAMDNAWSPDDEFIDDVMMWREFAEKVAAEYARSSSKVETGVEK